MSQPVELAALVGMGAFSRGRAYARQGRARVIDHDPETGRVIGTCEGSGANSYVVSLEYEYSPAGVLTAVEGHCTCPVGSTCKHVVAVLLTALAEADEDADADPGSDTTHNRGPSWRDVFAERVPGDTDDLFPLALALDFSPPAPPDPPVGDGRRRRPYGHRSYATAGHLSARPLRMGKRGRWIVTGATWSNIGQSTVVDADPEQLDALDELRRMDPDRDPYYSSSHTWIPLSGRTTPDLWRVLDRVADSGVELVESETFRPVHLEPVRARADVTVHLDDAGDLHLAAALLHPALTAGCSVTRCGTPVHGLAWRDPAGDLHLAGLEQPASLIWTELDRQSRPVRVPARDLPAFERTVLPRLERSGWTSPDASFTPTPPPPPTLRLDVTTAPTSGVSGAPGARLHWSWVRPGDEGVGVDIEARGRFAVDEGEVGTRLLGEVCDVLSTIGGGVGGGIGAGVDEGAPQVFHVGASRRPVQDLSLRGMDVVRLLEDLCPQLVELGVDVHLHDMPELRDGGTPQVRVDIGAAGPDWFDLDVQVEVAGAEVPMAALVRALTLGEDVLFLPDGTYAHLDDPTLDRLRRLLAEAAELSDQRRTSLRVPQVRLSWWEELLELGVIDATGHAWLRALHDAVAHPPAPAPLPAGLRATLRPYQLEGFRWLAHLRRSGLGGVLADDMGLGKTIQVLAMVLDEREDPGVALVNGEGAAVDSGTPEEARSAAVVATEVPGAQVVAAADAGAAGAEDGGHAVEDGAHAAGRGPWLVVAPTSVVPNWVAESQRFAPGLRAVAIEATRARRGTDLAEATRGADIVVTSYALLRLEEQDYADLGVTGLVLDEAQNAKNHTSRTFAAVKKVGAPVVFAITGTPMENHLGELWSMFALTAPGLLGTPAQFTQSFRRPIERGDAGGGAGARRGVDTGGAGAGGGPGAGDLMALLRRRIAPFLLRRTKEDVVLDLPPKQEQVLEVELAPAHRRLYDRHLQRERQRILGLAEDLEHNRVEVLAALTRLRQLAIDPSLVEEGSSAPSSKMEVLVPLLEQAAHEAHRVLVFSQFTRYLRRIAERLEEAGVAYSYLDGTTPRRRQVIDGFAHGDDPVFLISLKAGGVGLNLAMADYAVLADPWWNPAAEAQAVDRAHRIGQTRPVHVYRLVSRDTIEEKVLALQDRKRELAASVLAAADEVGGGVSAIDPDALAPTGTEGASASGHARAAGGARLSAEDLRDLLG